MRSRQVEADAPAMTLDVRMGAMDCSVERPAGSWGDAHVVDETREWLYQILVTRGAQ
jgi:hypothetical protein